MSYSSVGLALLAFCIGCSVRAEAWGLDRTGLDMTILAIGTCLIVATVTQTKWKSARVMYPLLNLGQRSYEVYLTHMFVVFAVFQLFVLAGKPIGAVLSVFIVVFGNAGVWEEVSPRFSSDPLNLVFCEILGNPPNTSGFLVETDLDIR